VGKGGAAFFKLSKCDRERGGVFAGFAETGTAKKERRYLMVQTNAIRDRCCGKKNCRRTKTTPLL